MAHLRHFFWGGFLGSLFSETMKLSALLLSFLLTHMAVTVSLASGRTFSPGPALVSAADALAAEPPRGDLLPVPGLFDVTDYGAIADGKTDNSLAFMAAWEEACAYAGNSTFYIPHGTFFVGEVSFAGPCFNDHSPKVVILGTLRAPSSLDSNVWIHFKNLRQLSLTGGNGSATLDGQGTEAWSNSDCRRRLTCDVFPTSLKLSDVSYGNISDINLVNSKGFHVAVYGCENVHLSGFNIRAPWDSQNTDGIHISHSTNVNVTASDIGVGDDCVSIGPGSVNVSVSDVRCGPGHGISVGSLGRYEKEDDVVGIKVENCLINGTQNGVRVKTWPGDHASNATNLTFQNIVMYNVSNPIIIDQRYCASSLCHDRDREASSVKLRDITIKNISGSYNSKFAVNLDCSSIKPCENIQLSDINLTAITKPEANKQIGRFSCKGALDAIKILNSRF